MRWRRPERKKPGERLSRSSQQLIRDRARCAALRHVEFRRPENAIQEHSTMLQDRHVLMKIRAREDEAATAAFAINGPGDRFGIAAGRPGDCKKRCPTRVGRRSE